ncbi:MAG: M20/M25/M40 family metallo-hydrolase [Deltaproteobacteria bacterium]|nr:M20/M25/M40 family metallo-hydrolase [Deltaproteobacteria bacterium]
MKKKMIGFILLVIILLAAYLIYAVVKIRFTPSVVMPRQEPASRGDTRQFYRHVEHMSVRIGSRSVYEYSKLEETKRYIVSCLENFGYTPELQKVTYDGQVFNNVTASIKGKSSPDETVVIGAHYDTVFGAPGADDNASAVAVLLEMSRILKSFPPGRTIKLVFFVLEEPPVFRTEHMGSYVYAKDAKAKNENIKAMICLEMLGYYADKKGGQTFPLPLMGLMYSSTPDFIAVVGNLQSRSLVERVKNTLKRNQGIPVESLSTVGFVPGVDFSDHWSFWKMGYPAVMITDTAFYRNPNYHTEKDTIDTLDFNRMTELLNGLEQVAKDLSTTSSQ